MSSRSASFLLGLLSVCAIGGATLGCSRAVEIAVGSAGPARTFRSQASLAREHREPEPPTGEARCQGEACADPNAPCPEEMAHVGRFCIDRWEAHLEHETGGRFTVVLPHTERPVEGRTYRAASRAGQWPQPYVSREDAARACEQAGKRLCTFREWRRACRGTQGKRYPYGWRIRAGACNVGKPHLMPELFGDDTRLWTYEQFNGPELHARTTHLALAGASAACVTTEGVHDLVGNLHEWVSGVVTDDFMEMLERDDVERDKQPWTEGNGVFVGGFFSTTNEHGPGCLFTTVAHEPRYHDYSTGFRCCRDAHVVSSEEPAASSGGR